MRLRLFLVIPFHFRTGFVLSDRPCYLVVLLLVLADGLLLLELSVELGDVLESLLYVLV